MKQMRKGQFAGLRADKPLIQMDEVFAVFLDFCTGGMTIVPLLCTFI